MCSDISPVYRDHPRIYDVGLRPFSSCPVAVYAPPQTLHPALTPSTSHGRAQPAPVRRAPPVLTRHHRGRAYSRPRVSEPRRALQDRGRGARAHERARSYSLGGINNNDGADADYGASRANPRVFDHAPKEGYGVDGLATATQARSTSEAHVESPPQRARAERAIR
jgi:hypothetical protein